jgi:hypothetical protein
MPSVIEGLQAVTVHVTDPQRARNFHPGVLGLEEEGPNPKIPRVVFRIPGSPTRLLLHVRARENRDASRER